MNYSNPMCVTCHYDEKSKRVNAMIRIANMLNMLNLNIRDIKQYRKFNWGNNDKCRVGLTCSKTLTNERYYTQYTHELDNKLSAFIEQCDDEKAFNEILYWLRGNFPSVCTYFEREYRKRN